MTAEDSRLLAVRAAVDRFVHGRTSTDPEDVTQEAMARLLANRHRLHPDTWASYAVTVAGNLLRDQQRADAVRQRRAHLVPAPQAPVDPVTDVLSAEEHAAMRRAVTGLESDDARLLAEHYGAEPETLRPVSPNRARLAGARSKLRVAYVLEHSGITLPTTRCRPVLEALSSGDRRRQERLGASRHLLACRTCATCAPALQFRDRALAGLHPLAWLVAGGSAVWAAVRQRPAQATVAVALAATAVVVVAEVDRPSPSRDAAAPPTQPASRGAQLTVDGRPLLRLDPGRPVVGAATGVDLRVLSVPADEGFWVELGPGERVWLQLEGRAESSVQVEVDDIVSFTGRALPVDEQLVRQFGVTPEEGGDELLRSGLYIAVPRAALRLRR